MPSLSSALSIMRERGAATLAAASMNLAWAGLHRLAGQRFVRKRVHSYQMWLDLEDRGLSRALLLFGTREVDHKIILEKVLGPGMRVLDIGANIGYYALMELALVGPAGHLVAVEPSPSNVALLKRNLELNGLLGRVKVIEGALSDQPGRKSFFLSAHSNLGTFHNVGSAVGVLDGRTVEVACHTLAEIAAESGAPDLIRMDVEGHEVEILAAALPAIEAGTLAPMIAFEPHLSRYGADHDFAPILRRLFAAGYKTRWMSSSSPRGTAILEGFGYPRGEVVMSDGIERVLFENVAPDHAIDILTRTGGARTVLLAKAA